jgi:signal transduction histidine kinase/DNA-binding response OmpR family regulator/ligand-binding sensor domain-containing protein
VFEKYMVKQGLSINEILKITQDEQGFIYAATYNGLNVFDGTNFKQYNSANTPGFCNDIIDILPIRSNIILIGSELNGLYILNKEKDKIVPLNIKTESGPVTLPVTSLHLDTEGLIWIGTRNAGIYSFHSDSICKSHLTKPIYTNKYSDAVNFAVSGICSTKKNIWIGTFKNGIYSLSKEKNRKIFKPAIKLNDEHVWALKVYNDTLYAGTEKGLTIIDLLTGNTRLILEETDNGKHFTNLIRAITRDSYGNIWVGSQEDGLYKLKTKRNSFDITHFKSTPFNIASLNTNKILSLYAGKFDNIWIGTWNGGINKYSIRTQTINNIRNHNKANILSENMVKCLVPKNKNSYWVGTYGSGICIYDINKDYFYEKIYIQQNNSVSSLLKDEERDLLLAGTWGNGVMIYKTPSLNTVYSKYLNDEGLKKDRVYSIVKDEHGIYWIGTITNGIYSLNLNDNKKPLKYFNIFNDITKPAENNAEIRQILTGYEPNTLIVLKHDYGIYKIKINDKGEIVKVNNMLKNIDLKKILNFSRFRCIYLDDEKNLYIGTDNGVLVRNYKTAALSSLLSGHNYIVQDITQDNDNNFWFGLYSGGIIKYGPVNENHKMFLPSVIVIKLYYNNRHKKLFAATHSGIYEFDPSRLKDDPFYPEVYFDNLVVQYTHISPEDTLNNRQILQDHINYTKEFSLPFSLNSFSLDINTISYSNPEKNIIKYKLEGSDNRWHEYTGSHLTVTYENIMPGNYTLIVNAANKDNVWNPETREIKITVLPPWWKTSWAYAFYVILFLLTGYVIFVILKNKATAIHKKKLEEMTKEKEKILYEQKLRLFTNISHDIRTPLTLIIGPLENILSKEEPDTWLNKQHRIIHKNALFLLNLVNQILDLRKADHQQLKLNYSKVPLIHLTRELMSQFEGVTHLKDISMALTTSEDEIIACVDKEQFEKVIMNLISNAVNHVPQGGLIEILIERQDTGIIIKIKDNGKGIDPEDLPNLFERFYQSKYSKTGAAGIGLALVQKIVELHKGTIEASSIKDKETVFTIQLPDNKNRCSSDKDTHVPYSKTMDPRNAEEEQYPVSTELLNEKTSAYESVLVIDDNDDIREYLKENLSDKFRVHLANSGEEGLNKAKTLIPSLVICDIMMDGIDGLEVCEKLKSNILTSHIPVILLTSKTSEESTIEGFEKGADDYVFKPFSIKLLKSRIRNLIDQRTKLKGEYSSLKLPEASKPQSLDEEFLTKAINYIEENISDKDLGVEKIASSMNLTHDQYYRKIKNITGLSANKFTRKIRLNKAAEYIKANRYTISEILYMVGFSSPSYFTKSFKDEFGCTPTEMLEKYQNKKS